MVNGMARAALGLGESGDIQYTRQQLIDGKWKTAKNGSADRWKARVHYRGHDGTYAQLYGFGKTKIAAKQALDRKLKEKQRTRATEGLTSRTKLVDAGKQWVEDIQRSDSGLSPRSIDDYRRTFFRYIDAPGSSLRGLTLAEADDPGLLTSFLRHVADHHGSGAVKQTRIVLRHIFAMAVRLRAIPSNPMRDVGRVSPRTSKRTGRDTSRAFTRDERDHVVQFAYDLAAEEGLNPRTRRKRETTADLIAFLAGTGVRINEARTLRWEHVDLSSGVVIIPGTKTRAAYRTVNLTSWLADHLRDRAERVGTSGYVFGAPAHEHNDKLWDQSKSSNALNDVLRAAGHPWVTPHSFRRTIVTDLHKSGVPLNEVADWAGHADVVVTSRYLGRDLGSDKAGLAALL
jgi:integrase